MIYIIFFLMLFLCSNPQIQELFAKKADPNSKLTQSEFESKLKNAEEKLSTQVKSLTSQGYSGLKEALVELNQKIKPNSEIEEYFKKYIVKYFLLLRRRFS